MDDAELEIKIRCGRVLEEEEPGCEGTGVMRYRVMEERVVTRRDLRDATEKHDQGECDEARCSTHIKNMLLLDSSGVLLS